MIIKEKVEIIDRFCIKSIDFERLDDPNDSKYTMVHIMDEMIGNYMATYINATLNEVHHYLIIRGVGLGILQGFDKEYESAWPFLMANYNYDGEKFHLRPIGGNNQLRLDICRN